MNVSTWEFRDWINQFPAQAGVRCHSTPAKAAGDVASTELSYLEQSLTLVWELCLLKKHPPALSQHSGTAHMVESTFPEVQLGAGCCSIAVTLLCYVLVWSLGKVSQPSSTQLLSSEITKWASVFSRIVVGTLIPVTLELLEMFNMF